MMYADPFLNPPPELYDNFRTMDPALLDAMANYQAPEENPKDKIKGKGKGRLLLDKIGQGVDSIGGFGAIGSTADQIRNLIGRKDQDVDSSANNGNQNQMVAQPVPNEKGKMPGWVKGVLIGLGIGGTVALVLLLAQPKPAIAT